MKASEEKEIVSKVDTRGHELKEESSSAEKPLQ